MLSQITKNVGGNESHTDTDSEGTGNSDSISLSRSIGTSTNWGTTRSSGVTHSGGGPFGLFPDRSTNRGDSRTRGGGTNETDTRGGAAHLTELVHAPTPTRTGTNWSDADTTQRVYEYAVEPVTLQHLPDHALLLVETLPKAAASSPPSNATPPSSPSIASPPNPSPTHHHDARNRTMPSRRKDQARCPTPRNGPHHQPSNHPAHSCRTRPVHLPDTRTDPAPRPNKPRARTGNRARSGPVLHPSAVSRRNPDHVTTALDRLRCSARGSAMHSEIFGLDEAIALATRAHAGQTDKAGRPYIEHPLRVMRRLGANTNA